MTTTGDPITLTATGADVERVVDQHGATVAYVVLAHADQDRCPACRAPWLCHHYRIY